MFNKSSRRERRCGVSKTHWETNLSQKNTRHRRTKWIRNVWLDLSKLASCSAVGLPRLHLISTQQAEASVVTTQPAIPTMCNESWSQGIIRAVKLLNLTSSSQFPLFQMGDLSISQRSHTFPALGHLHLLFLPSMPLMRCGLSQETFPATLSQWTLFNILLTTPSCLISLTSSFASKYLILPQLAFYVFSLPSLPLKGKLHKSRDPVLPTQEPQGLFSNGYLINIYWMNVIKLTHGHSKGLYGC